MGSGNSKENEPEEAKKKEVLSDPWRKIAQKEWNEEELLQLKKEVMAYKCPSTKLDFFNILLVGQISAGKSSIINTIVSAFDEKKEVTVKAVSGAADKSLTKQLKAYQIKTGNKDDLKKPIKFQFWDTMGLEVEDEGLDIEKICMIMDGKVKSRAKLEGTLDKLRENPEKKDEMHCLIFVVHAEKFGTIDQKVLGKLTKIRLAANERDIPCLVVCTAMDKMCDHVEKDTSKVFHSRNVRDKFAMVSAKSGFPLNMIHPQRNYVEETKTEIHIDFLTMLLFKQLIKVSNDFCEDLIDQENEND